MLFDREQGMIRLRTVAAVLGIGLAAFVGIALATEALNLPGPRIRETIGLAPDSDNLNPCKVSASQDRTPASPAPTGPKWRSEPVPLPDARDEIRTAVVGSDVYLLGGLGQNGRSTARVDIFHAGKGRYTRPADLPDDLDHIGAVAYRGQIYVTGGWSDGTPNNRMWRYSPRTKQWTELASMKVSRGAPAIAAADGKIYVAGGTPHNQEQPYDSIEVYDIADDRWLPGPNIPTARHHVGSALLGNDIYVVGGRTPNDFQLDTFEALDVASGKWDELPSMPAGSGGTAAVAADGKLVAIGGGSDSERWVTAATWQYDPATRRWERLQNLEVPRHGHGAANVNGRIYVFGGSPCAGFGFTEVVESRPAS
jgi:N-acetylneuraminic acid mutarotase